MGYFSNGTEGDIYQERYCYKGTNYGDGCCPILRLHLLWNYEQFPEDDAGGVKHEALENFIPRNQDGDNGECLMFLPTSALPAGR